MGIGTYHYRDLPYRTGVCRALLSGTACIPKVVKEGLTWQEIADLDKLCLATDEDGSMTRHKVGVECV